MKRLFVFSLALCLMISATNGQESLTIAVGAKVEGDDGERKPNIVLVMADDHGWGDVGYNDHPFVQTPELDAMAKKATIVYRHRAWSPTSGIRLYRPVRLRTVSARTMLLDELLTIAHAFQ